MSLCKYHKGSTQLVCIRIIFSKIKENILCIRSKVVNFVFSSRYVVLLLKFEISLLIFFCWNFRSLR